MEHLSDGENLLEPCNNQYWKAPVGKTGKEAEIIIDLKCPMLLDTFSIINGFGTFGLKMFSLFGSRTISGPWNELYTGELPPGKIMNEKVICTQLSHSINKLLYKHRTFRGFSLGLNLQW